VQNKQKKNYLQKAALHDKFVHLLLFPSEHLNNTVAHGVKLKTATMCAGTDVT